ncbi:DUF4123 domain-containing protein [Luteolibacter sp. SL250]|uniref:DUF4123 domain-containing protein n=1 Tax=Luteolibacter sp. SL250 TaxID=2995170 RepID=UPI00226E6187|nr:DUF4123 domain-containing protein [Luteolibacter sp. SL250]WAC21840.1 DUF4123 domain-containing protein [Luteolibacter sp. SL250]
MAAPAPISPQLQLRDALFPTEGDPNLATYTIIDGAACEGLLDRLDEFKPEYCCLYAGELEEDIEEVAPYLIQLEHDHPFTLWLLENIKAKPWGIFCKAPSTLREMRKHFRKFLIVKGPEGNNLYFRFYDPRVLPTFIKSCEGEQKSQFYGPVECYLCPGQQMGGMSRLSRSDLNL